MRQFGFRIDGVQYRITEEDTAEIADRLAHRHNGDVSHPAYSAQVMVDAMIEGDQTPAEWHGPEKDQLFAAIQDWIDDKGVADVPDSVQNIRYGVFGERQDHSKKFPPGAYLMLWSQDGAELESVQKLDGAPVPGQPFPFEGRTVIVETVTPAPGTEYVAVIRARHHPG